MVYDYVERILREEDDVDAITTEMVDNGYELWLTTMHEDRKVKSVTFRKVSE